MNYLFKTFLTSAGKIPASKILLDKTACQAQTIFVEK